jgi:hypothetical protein
MAWTDSFDSDMYFDEEDYNTYSGQNQWDDYDEWDNYDDSDFQWQNMDTYVPDNSYVSPYESPYQQASQWADATPQEYAYTDRVGGVGGSSGGLGGLLDQGSGLLNKYAGKGTFAGGLLGGDKGRLDGSDIAGYGRNLFDAYMGKRDNDRYNEMMQPMTDLYRDQAADVRNRRANRDTNLASEWEIASGLMQPGRERMDQRAANLAQHQGVTQSSSNAWNKAANLQTRELTDLVSRQKIADAYDIRTGTLGGQLSGYNPATTKGYLERQENPYLGMLSSSITG